MISAAVTGVVAQFRLRAPHIGCALPGLSGVDGHWLRTGKIDPALASEAIHVVSLAVVKLFREEVLPRRLPTIPLPESAPAKWKWPK
jgi:hypothetical protein